VRTLQGVVPPNFLVTPPQILLSQKNLFLTSKKSFPLKNLFWPPQTWLRAWCIVSAIRQNASVGGLERVAHDADWQGRCVTQRIYELTIVVYAVIQDEEAKQGRQRFVTSHALAVERRNKFKTKHRYYDVMQILFHHSTQVNTRVNMGSSKTLSQEITHSQQLKGVGGYMQRIMQKTVKNCPYVGIHFLNIFSVVLLILKFALWRHEGNSRFLATYELICCFNFFTVWVWTEKEVGRWSQLVGVAQQVWANFANRRLRKNKSQRQSWQRWTQSNKPLR